MGKGIEIVLAEEFEEFQRQTRKQIEELRQELEFFKGLVSFLDWVGRAEARQILGCSDTTLWRLQKSGRISTSSVNGSVRYSVKSMKEYLEKRSFVNN